MVAFNKLSCRVNVVLLLNQSHQEVANVEIVMEVELGDKNHCTHQVPILDHLPRIFHKLLLTDLQVESVDELKDALWVHGG